MPNRRAAVQSDMPNVTRPLEGKCRRWALELGFQSKGYAYSASPPSEPVSEDERMAILKMLQEKKITAEQAEQLLNALEGGK